MRERDLQSRCWVLLLSGALVVAVTAAMQMNNIEKKSLASRYTRSTEPLELEGKQELFLKKSSKVRQKLSEKAARVTEAPPTETPKPESPKEEQNVTRTGSGEDAEERREGRFVGKFKEWYEGKKQPEEKKEETEIIINSHLSGGPSHPHFPYYHHHVPVVQPIIIGGGSTVITKPVTQLVTHTLVVQEPQAKPTVVFVHEPHEHESKPTQIIIHASHHHHEEPTYVVTHTHSSTYEEQPTLVIVEAPHTHHPQTVTITQVAPSHSKPPHIVIQESIPAYNTPSHVFIQEPHIQTIVHPHGHHHHPEWDFGVDFIGQAEGSVHSHDHVVHVVKPLESSHGSSTPTMSEVIVVERESGGVNNGFKKIKDTFYDIGKNIKDKFDEQVTGLSSMFTTEEHAHDHSHVIILQKPDPKPKPVVQTVTLHQHPKAHGHVKAVFAGQGHFQVGRGHPIASTSTITIQTVQTSSCVYCG